MTQTARRSRAQPLRIAFADFWPRFDSASNFLVASLGKSARIELTARDPDVVFFSDFGTRHAHYRASRSILVYFSAENVAPDFNRADYAITSNDIGFGDRHLRLPLYALDPRAAALEHRGEIGIEAFRAKTEFCNYVVSNGVDAHPFRDRFFRDLHRSKPVTSAGRHLPNAPSLDARFEGGTPADKKLRFQSAFRFSLALENSSVPGYVTEKITDAYLARTVPIYWGDPTIAAQMNAASLVHVDPDAPERAIRTILDLDAAPDRVMAMLNAPVFAAEAARPTALLRALDAFLFHIADQAPQAARRRPAYGRARIIEMDRAPLAQRIRRVLRRHPGPDG